MIISGIKEAPLLQKTGIALSYKNRYRFIIYKIVNIFIRINEY